VNEMEAEVNVLYYLFFYNGPYFLRFLRLIRFLILIFSLTVIFRSDVNRLLTSIQLSSVSCSGEEEI
jgi:hypothetical protein